MAFLGELSGVPFDDEQSPRLRAARGDPQVMSTQVARTLVTFLQELEVMERQYVGE